MEDRIFVIDQGNSQTKLAVFQNGLLQQKQYFTVADPSSALCNFLRDNRLRTGIYSSVRNSAMPDLGEGIEVLKFSHATKLPIELHYESPSTLGLDRISNAVGARAKYDASDIMVVDFGTCITYTIIRGGILLGGAISPGIDLRFKALNQFTGQLPLVQMSAEDGPELLGRSTRGSILAGVQWAAVLECDAMIAQYCSVFSPLLVIGTGGMLSYFEKHLKSTIFADPDLTLQGLYEIYKYGQN